MTEQARFEPGQKVRKRHNAEYVIIEIGEWIIAEDQDGTRYEFDDDELEAMPLPPTPDDALEEKVARAICKSVPGTGNVDEHFDVSAPHAKSLWINAARAAIQAIQSKPVAQTKGEGPK